MILGRNGEVVSQPVAPVEGERGKGNAGLQAFDAAQLPARHQSVALEQKHLYGVERQVVADVIAQLPLSVEPS